MSRCADATHGDSGATEMIMNNVRPNVQLCADLAQGPSLGIRLCCTLNVHRTTYKVSPALESALCRRKPMSYDTVRVNPACMLVLLQPGAALIMVFRGGFRRARFRKCGGGRR